MDNNKKNKSTGFSNFINFLKQMWKSPRGKAVFFFAFYLIFFIVVILMIRLGSTSSTIDNETTSSFNYSLNKIVNANYHYNYNINLNNINYIFDGDKINSKEKFTYTSKDISNNYYRNSDLFLQNINNDWIKVDNPYILKEFINIDMIKTILSSATYISKTDYESGRVTYHYEISTTTLLKLLENKNIDIEDVPNKIDITAESNNEVNEISYDLTSYVKYADTNNTICTIKLDYSKFNEIEEIAEP